MKVVIDRDELLGILKTLNLAVDNNSTTGRIILSHIRIDGLEGRCIFSATNLQLGILQTVKATTELPGKCTVNAKRLFELIKHFEKKKNIVLTIMEDGRLRVSQGRSRYLLNTMKADDMPAIPYFKTEDYMPIDPQSIHDALSHVLYAVSVDETRINLNGVLFDPAEEGTMRVVSTDGHRLACIKIPGVIDKQVIIPTEACKVLLKLIKGAEEIGIKMGDGQMNVCLENGVIDFRTIARNYPEYRKIFPTGKHLLVKISRKDTIDAVKRMRIFSGDSHRLTFSVEEKSLIVTARDRDADVTEELPVLDLDGFEEPFQISMNATFFLQAFEHLRDDEVSLRIYGNRRPVEIAERNLTKVIMPMV